MQNNKSLSLKLAAVLLLGLGLWQLGGGFYIKAKAVLAQILVAEAWSETLAGHEEVRPWPWADTWPIARLKVPEHGIDLYVLEGGSGRTLAFGPGHVESTALPGEVGHAVLGGHRDTHFSFLRDIGENTEILVQRTDGSWQSYQVRQTSIIDTREARLLPSDGRTALTLVTCYPFDALTTNGPLRYLVFAEAQMDN